MKNPIQMYRDWEARELKNAEEREIQRTKDFEAMIQRNVDERMAKEKAEMTAYFEQHTNDYLIPIAVPLTIYLDNGALKVVAQLTEILSVDLNSKETMNDVQKELFISLIRKLISDEIIRKARAQVA